MSGQFKNVVGYSPSDFFYVSALDSSHGANIDCANIDLGNIDLGNLQLGNIDLRHDAKNLKRKHKKTLKLYKEVCLNQQLANTWTDQKLNHAGSSQALDDSHASYNATVLNTMNLVVGIGFLTWALTSGWMYR